MGIYQAPVHRSTTSTTDEDWSAYAQLHLGFYPPLLRSSTVKKFLVGCVSYPVLLHRCGCAYIPRLDGTKAD